MKPEQHNDHCWLQWLGRKWYIRMAIEDGKVLFLHNRTQGLYGYDLHDADIPRYCNDAYARLKKRIARLAT
jgi:hypothetical protein